MNEVKCALVFPGQGLPSEVMLDEVLRHPAGKTLYNRTCEILGIDLSELLQCKGPKANSVSSITSVLSSILAMEKWKTTSHLTPTYFAGYSVGQWTALYAANILDFESLIQVVKRRADIMDHALERLNSGMIAVIGLSQSIVETVCQELRGTGHQLWVSNYNCVGQYSLGGLEDSLKTAKAKFDDLGAKKTVYLPVSGAWHTPLLHEANKQFRIWLDSIHLSGGHPVADNVTGSWLPLGEKELKDQLAAHLDSPVQWEKCLKMLISQGTKQVIELGCGQTLTKFGFFIDRKVQHLQCGP